MSGQTGHGTNKYAHLDRLSTEALEEFLRADMESPDDDNDEAIFHILEVIEQREKDNPTGRLVDVDEAWAEFQQYYNIPEGEGLSLYPATDETDGASGQARASSAPDCHKRAYRFPVWRRIGVIAAAVAVFFALLIGAQAAGVDVFGALGRWTDETFRFVSSAGGTNQNGVGAASDSENISEYRLIQAALEKCGITEALAPTWYPAGYEAGEPQILSNKAGDTVNVAFCGEGEGFFAFDVTRNQPEFNMSSFTFEKDDSPVELYTSGGRTFFIMSNLDTMTAAWTDGRTMITIAGSLTKDELKSMIDSIGGEAS